MYPLWLLDPLLLRRLELLFSRRLSLCDSMLLSLLELLPEELLGLTDLLLSPAILYSPIILLLQHEYIKF
jgi:hypothetical protein